MGRLTTHVLDLATGQPAFGLEIELVRGDGGTPLKTVRTNEDGRVDTPLLEGEAFAEGTYELRFAAGDYLRSGGHTEPFLEVVPIRFHVSDASAHYHVPLLLSPFGYSTYRGS